MRVTGLDPGNDQALARVIVFHSTRYPYTWGCFATTRSTNIKLISLMRGGAFVYVAH
jgi:L,D-peptidoglycan transpeptidase YkuD (ErfK/YbiS/YcfS/YnhG family)